MKRQNRKAWRVFSPSAASSYYEERRSREWLKIKITHVIECVIGGYTDPEGSRQHFGAIVLGLYDKKQHLIHTGQAGTGFDQRTLARTLEAAQTAGDTTQSLLWRSGGSSGALGKT